MTVYSDCCSLVENLKTVNTNIAEKRLIIDLFAMKESIKSGAIQKVKWCPTEVQVADCLTKLMDNPVMVRALMKGEYPVMTAVTKRTMKSEKETPVQQLLSAIPALALLVQLHDLNEEEMLYGQ